MRRAKLLSILLAAAAVLGVVSLPSALRAEEDATGGTLSAASPQDLVELLASGKYRDRVRATRELERRGIAAKEALLAGAESRDAEVRQRCQKVLAVVLTRDFEARIRAFAADREGTSGHGLPGWERFRRLAPPTRQNRDLFASMLAAERELFVAQERGPEQVALALEARCDEINQEQHRHVFGEKSGVSLAMIVSLLFAAGDERVAVSERTSALLGNFSYQESLQNALGGGPHVDLARRVLGQWVERGEGGPGSFQNLLLAMKHGLSEGLKPAEAMIRRGTAQPQIIVYAIQAVGRFGDARHIELLAPLLADESVAMTYQDADQKYQTEVRDVALAVLVHLSGQDYADYGFRRIVEQPDFLFNAGTIGFADPAERTAALEKWQAWMAEQGGEVAPESNEDSD